MFELPNVFSIEAKVATLTNGVQSQVHNAVIAIIMRVVIVLRKPDLRQVVEAFSLDTIQKCVHASSLSNHAAFAFLNKESHD